MVSRNNVKERLVTDTERLPHYGIRKLSVGVASVLLGTTLYLGSGAVVHADTVNTDGQGSTPKEETKANVDTHEVDVTSNTAPLSNSKSAVSVDNNTRGVNSNNNTASAATVVSDIKQPQSTVSGTGTDIKQPQSPVSGTISNELAAHSAAASNASSQVNSAANAVSEHSVQANSANERAQKLAVKPSNVFLVARKVNLAESKVTDSNNTGVYIAPNQDGNKNKELVGTGKSETVTLSDGSSLTTESNILDDKKTSAILTFKSSAFKAGDTYTIKIPKKGGLSLSAVDIAKLQPAFGTTTFDNSNSDWYVVTDKFINSGTVSQNIKLSRKFDLDEHPDLGKLGSFTEIANDIDLLHGDETKTLTITNFSQELHMFGYSSGLTSHSPDAIYIVDRRNPVIINNSEIESTYELDINTLIHYGSWDVGSLKTVKIHVDKNGLDSGLSIDSVKLLGYDNSTVLAEHNFDSDGNVELTSDDFNIPGHQIDELNLRFRMHVSVSDDKFVHHKYNIPINYSAITISAEDYNHVLYTNNPTIGSAIVVNDLSDLTIGDLLTYSQGYMAGYVDNDYSTPLRSNSVLVNNGRKNWYGASSLSTFAYNVLNAGKSVKTNTNQGLFNFEYTVNIPDGLDFVNRNDMYASINRTNYKFHSGDYITVKYRDGSVSSTNVNQIPRSDKSISSISVHLANFKNSSIQLSTENGVDLLFSKTYADGTPVQAGDLFTITATLSADGAAPQTVDLTYIRAADHNQNLPKGVSDSITVTQSDKTPGTKNAGDVHYFSTWNYSGIINVYPQYEHPVVYLAVPKNASFSDLSGIQVYTLNASNFGQDLTPKSISTIKIDNTTFIKVDLSNYNKLDNGVEVFVPYDNLPDVQSSSEKTAFLVTADNLNDSEMKNVHHYADDASSNLKTVFGKLVTQEKLDANHTDYYESTLSWEMWDILTSDGLGSATMTSGNKMYSPSLDSKQDDHGPDADQFDIYGTAINATDISVRNATQVINIPNVADGTSQFNVQLTGPISLVNANTGADLSQLATIHYSTSRGDLSKVTVDNGQFTGGLLASQVTDWSKIQSVMIRFNSALPARTSARAVLHVKDPQIYDHVGKTINVENVVYAYSYTGHDVNGFELKPVYIKPGSPASAKLTVEGQATVTTWVHYQDASGKDQYVQLPDKTKIYNELSDTIKRSDFMSSDSDLTTYDKLLLPSNLVIDWNRQPTIQNSNNTYLDGYQNGTAEFDKIVKYDFDGDRVVYEAGFTKQVSQDKMVKRTIHYKYVNRSTAKPDVVQTSKTFTNIGFENPFTHQITWAQSTDSDNLTQVVTPTIAGYTPDNGSVDSLTITPDAKDTEVTVVYNADRQNITIDYIDDTTRTTLNTQSLTGLSDASANYNTKSAIDNYKSQGYDLVSDNTNGNNLVFDHDTGVDQHYEVHFKHHLENVSQTSKVNETINYVYAKDNSPVKPAYHANAITFVQNGVSDAVTKQTAWSPVASQQFASVTSPQIDGYTADLTNVPAITVNFGDADIVRTVIYSPKTQNLDVAFIDDTTGETLKTIRKSGPSDTSADYNTKNDLDGYKAQHYNVVSDSTNGRDLVFDHTDNVDQHYEVHLSHATHSINEAHDVSQVIHYVYQNGSKAGDDYTNHVHFARDGYHDEVTSVDHWNAWTPSATQQFDAVHSPAVKGYTPDTDQITAVTVNPDSQSIERTVTYTPDAQKLDVTFIDDTAGTTLKTVVKNGVTNADTNYSTKSDIQNYESQHYVLVSDSSNGAELVFDNDDAVDQHYVVHLKHNTHAIDEHHVINETVHYKMSDGTKAPDDYQAEALSFSRDGFNDEVTGIDHWNAWAPKAEQTFGEVASPLVAGYTPDIDQINTQTVKPTDHDLEFTVTYTPNVQIAHVKYIDDTDHKVLTQDDLNGRTSETSGYHTTDRITEFKGQHYVFVSDNYPATGMTFDNNDRFDQIYEVHFKHGTRTDEQDVQVPRTIKYVYQNGQQAQPDHSDALSFHETKVVDLVDGHTVSDDWTPAQDFETVMTPEIQGYTPDHASVSNTGIAHDHSAIVETVTYNPDAQKAVVKYIDDTTGEQLEAKDLAGVSDQSTGYTTNETINGYINQHYVLVSDGTHGETVVFDHDDDADQSYEVHLKHGTEPDNESRIKKITVHYQYADGLARSGKAHDDQTVTNLTFKRTGTHDLVTDKIAWNAWDHTDQTFAAIDSPAIQGYTPDRTVVDNVKVNPDSHDLTEVTVTYNADVQNLSVDFIDDTTGKTLKTVNKTGHSDESADYNTKSDIQDLISKHYDLVSDATNGENLVFDHDDNINQHYEVRLSHHTHQINEQHTITETVHYQYADGLARSGKAADNFNANALTFSRNGFNDEVTGVDHWNAWTPSDQQTFTAVQSPVIEGYTPDQSEIGMIDVVPTSQSIEKTVTYTADAQKLTVNFIDDVTGQTLKTVAKTGHSDESADYDTKSDVQNFVGQHYDLVSDETKGADLVFDHNDGVDQVYNVHFTHHLIPISDHQVVNETIHYVYADGLARTGKAADDYTATPFEFNRNGKHDDVTGTDSWNAWIPGSSNFATVQSPAIQGYTPDHAQIDAVSVDANSQDIVKTITYSADQQKMTVDFIDDTDNGKVLKTVTKTGGSDEAVGYNTKADIQTFVDDHYKLDRDTTNGKDLVFDHDDAVDQHYEVHLTHETAPINEATSTSQVIHYQLADGTPVATDYTAKVDFSRDGFKDLVTNADHWNAWTPNATQTFDAVMSPAKAGYTPDHAQVDAVTVEPHHADLETTVTYSPDAQKASVKYIDDVTGKTLQTKELTGVSDETSTYTTESTIKQYVGQHYKLVSDQTNGKPIAFDHDDDNDQTFVVHLTHTYQDVSQEHQVHQTIHYQYADGKQAQPDYTAKELAFSRTGIQDLVTENIQWNAWTPDQVFAAVNTPALNGYTPDVQTVAPVKVSHDSKDIEQTVIYHADDQTILVNYIDDDTHSTLKTDSIIGKTAQTSDYTTKKSLDQYKGQHYDVVSDDTNGDTLTFDSDSTKVQTYNVHLKHQHQTASDKSTVHQTVHYVYQDGKQAAKDRIATPIEFTRTGDTDLVTGKTTWNAWTPATGTFGAVLSPIVAGYTPSRAMIDHVDVHAGDKDLDTTVTYVPDRQVIVVNYIDQVTGKTLKTDTLSGLSDQASGYTTKSQIDSYLGQHYKLISDATKGQTLTFDHDDQATQTYDVVLGHQTEAAHRTHEVHETVDYVYADGSQAAKSFTAKPLVFSQNGVHDLVTNTTDWNGEWTKPQVFASVESPKIIGFTASKPEVKAVKVNHQSGDVHELVIYAANAQTAQIKYIDDVTRKTLEVDGANGHFNESIVFSRNVNDQINKFKQAHYKLVSNNFAGQKYQADDTKNIYEVHLTHEYQKVHATDAVTETIKFQYVNGSQAQPTKIQAVNFGRDGIKDLVTGTTAWMPVDPQTIDAVDVPALDGYTADIQNVPAVTVNFGDGDITKVVTYKANDQLAGIKYIDDETGKTLDTEAAGGKFGTRIEFMDDPSSMIQKFEGQGYKFKSNSFNGQKYQADNSQNEFEVHFTHGTQNVSRTNKVTETVKYQFTDGRQAQKAHVQTVEFVQHGVQDLATKTIVWTPSDPQNFENVTTPELEGYTPDIQNVSAATVNFDDNNITKVVTYKANAQLAGIKYIDDTTGKTLDTEAAGGKFGTRIEFMDDPSSMIQKFNGEDYELVSNSFTAQDYQADNSKNQFEVHFKHGEKNVTKTSTVTRTIKYVDQKTGNEIHQPVIQTLTFTENGVMDLVTGETTWATSSDQQFDKVESPMIDGYENPDISVVDAKTAKFGDGDQTVIVKYQKVETPSASYTPKTTSHSKTSNSLDTSVATTNTTRKATQNISIRTSQTSTLQTGNDVHASRLPQTGNKHHTNQLPQTGTKSDSELELLGFIGIAVAGLFGFGKRRKKRN